jgi:hypothetical protein
LGDELELSPGDSQVQHIAELTMIAWLGIELDCELKSRRINLPDGSRLELDAFSEEPLIICEAWAHQGPPKSAQKMKIMNDAMKLLAARREVGDHARALLLFADDDAASHFRRKTWQAAALTESRIEVMVANLPAQLRADIRAAQTRQYR